VLSLQSPWRRALLLCLVFCAVAFAIYGPALRGPFHSDDALYIGTNPWTERITWQAVTGILDPTGEARFYQGNYAPVHLLATAVEIRVFGGDPLGYHVVNVLVHALNAALLVALFLSCGLSRALSSVGGLLFLVHPANVEAVAWISQLKTNGCLALSLGAVLAFRRHPVLATGLFASALLTKASAGFALPVVAALAWVRSSAEPRTPWLWIAVWALLLALYSIPQLSAFAPHSGAVVPEYADRLVHLRTIASIGLRYLVMAATSFGVAHAPEHPPVLSATDPWSLAALAVGILLAWRTLVTLRRRSPEGAFWIWAAAGFAPVSQLVPFPHPMADRYLYCMLPGLIGGFLFALCDARDWLIGFVSARQGSLPSAALLARAGLALGVAVAVAFGAQARSRSGLWGDPRLLSFDSARHYPNGRTAMYLAAQRAAQQGDVPVAVARLREAAGLGRDRFEPLLFDPLLAPLHGDPGFLALVDELVVRSIERLTTSPHPLSQNDRAALATAYVVRGQLDEAEQSLEAAIEQGGILTPRLEAQLAELRMIR
jgi:hypothetical protein